MPFGCSVALNNKGHLMGSKCSRSRFVAVVVILAVAPGAAMAYIDPGSGAYMVQALFALVGAALFYLRHPIRSLKTLWLWISRRSSRSEQSPSVGESELSESEHS
jgi:hypothetical protein